MPTIGHVTKFASLPARRLESLCVRPDSSNLDDYGIALGGPADFVVLDSGDPALAVAELAQPVMGFKAGRPTFTRPLPTIHAPPGQAGVASMLRCRAS